MSMVFHVIEKFTVKDTATLPQEILDAIASEEDRIEGYRDDEYFYKEIQVDIGDGWRKLTADESLRWTLNQSILSERRALSVYVQCEFTWRPFDLFYDEEAKTVSCVDYEKKEDPGFYFAELLEHCDDSVFGNLSFEFFENCDSSDSDRCGILRQFYLREDGTVYRGEGEFEQIDEIPDAEWLNEPLTLLVSDEEFTEPHDLDAVTAAARAISATEYFPREEPIDFRNPEEVLYVNQPKLETAEQRAAFFSALEALRLATNGEFFFDQPQFFDDSTQNVRILMLDLDRETGAVTTYMTKPIPQLTAAH